MILFLAIVLLLLGSVLMVAATIIMSVRQAVKSFLDGFPRQLHALMAESDPKVKKSLKMLETLPRISWAVGAGGILVFLLGVHFLGNHIAQGIILLLAITVSLLVFKYRDRLTPLLKKQLMDQMKKQAAAVPPLNTAQIRKNMQKARKAATPPPVTPVNRQQRREAQRRKQ